MKIFIALVVLILLWFWPLIRYEIWWRRWRRLHGHNPYKRGDSESGDSWKADSYD